MEMPEVRPIRIHKYELNKDQNRHANGIGKISRELSHTKIKGNKLDWQEEQVLYGVEHKIYMICKLYIVIEIIYIAYGCI